MPWPDRLHALDMEQDGLACSLEKKASPPSFCRQLLTVRADFGIFSLNDLNVRDRSPLLHDVINGPAPVVSYQVCIVKCVFAYPRIIGITILIGS